MEQQGYICLRKVLSANSVQLGMSCFVKDEVDYAKITTWIQNHLLVSVNQTFLWNSVYVKYRASQSNNSTDASTLHRDLIATQPDSNKVPVYTVLSYLDRATMQLVPGSHLHTAMSVGKAMKAFANSITLDLFPGDILVFHSCMLHRGLFTPGGSRRLVQVFEVFPNEATCNYVVPKVLHLQANETDIRAEVMVSLSRLPGIIHLLNFMGHMNAATGYGNVSLEGILFVSSEAYQPRLKVIQGTLQPNNRYILQRQTRVVSPQFKADLSHQMYRKQLYLYSLILLAGVVLITTTSRRVLANKPPAVLRIR